MELLSLPEFVIKKGSFHGHRQGKKKEKECYLTDQLKMKCKKKKFQGFHNIILRDHEFRIRTIEHHRDKEVYRRWDALADEDHTHHLIKQEYFCYKNKSWLHSNQQASDIIPLRNRSDLKQALSDLERLQQEVGETPHVAAYSTNTNNDSWQSSSSTWWNWPFFLVTDWSFAVDDDLLCPTMGVKTTPLMTFFFCDVSVQQFDYRWNYRSQNTVWLQVRNWTTKSRKK